MERVATQLGYEGCFGVEARGQSGGLLMLWKNRDDAQVIGYLVNHIDLIVNIDDMVSWRLTGLYGESNRNLRHNTWSLLRRLKDASDLPWCVMGDFNNIISHCDKKCGNPYPNYLLEAFNRTIVDCDLMDLDLIGHQFTWEKGRGSVNWIEVRLDRAMVNTSWWSAFQLAQLFNLEITLSDHCPILLQPKNFQLSSAQRRFRFENAWLTDPKCLELVKSNWSSNASMSI